MLSIALTLFLARLVTPIAGEGAGLVRADDYPQQALDANEQGTVNIRASVAPDGRVNACRVTKSSKSVALDETTCKIVVARGHFERTAAREHGRPFDIALPIHWVIAPADPTRFDVDLDRIAYTIDGRRIIGCRSEVASWRAPFPEACAMNRAMVEKDLAGADEQQVSGRQDYVLEAATIPGDHRFDNQLGENAGETLVARDSSLLSIDAAGKVIACAVGEHQNRTANEMRAWCKNQLAERFEPLSGNIANRQVRQLTRVGGTYFREASATTEPTPIK